MDLFKNTIQEVRVGVFVMIAPLLKQEIRLNMNVLIAYPYVMKRNVIVMTPTAQEFWNNELWVRWRVVEQSYEKNQIYQRFQQGSITWRRFRELYTSASIIEDRFVERWWELCIEQKKNESTIIR